MWNGILYSVLFKLFLRMPVFTQQTGYFFSHIMTDVVWKSLSVKPPFCCCCCKRQNMKDFFQTTYIENCKDSLLVGISQWVKVWVDVWVCVCSVHTCMYICVCISPPKPQLFRTFCHICLDLAPTPLRKSLGLPHSPLWLFSLFDKLWY